MIDLARIKKSGEGSILGKFLKDGGGGNLKTIGKQAIGGIINLAKDKIRGKLFGDRSTTPFDTEGGFNGATKNMADGRSITVNYGSFDNKLDVLIQTSDVTGITDVGGLMYSKTFNLTFREDKDEKLNFIDSSDEGGLAAKTPPLKINRNIFSKTPEKIASTPNTIFIGSKTVGNIATVSFALAKSL